MWIEHHAGGVTVALLASTNDHVDAINHAVQAARVAAAQLDPGNVAAIAGGEHAHVDDVVATRRNDRTLITSAGETVRNRETWTVTAIGTDGSLTVTREQGHGIVTLPADYAHVHVRLGYAATEHGYQSDTVDHSISLVSAVTTCRGLYVAATRGREQNLLCVVTDSGDVAEARDTLETILAFDRADIPAVTQRRNLAHQVPLKVARQQPLSTPRCEVPEWFEPLLSELRRELKVAVQAVTDSEVERARLAASTTAARRDLARTEAATAPAREQLAAATDTPIRRGGSTPTHNTASTRPGGAGDVPLATNSPPPMCAVSEPSNTSNTFGTAPARTSTGTTRRGPRRRGPSGPRRPGSAPPHRSPGAGPATTGRGPRAVESMGPRRHRQRPANRRHHRAAHRPRSPRRARRPVPTTRPSGTRLGRGRWNRPADQRATHANTRTSRPGDRSVSATKRQLDVVARDQRKSKRAPVPGSPRSRCSAGNRASQIATDPRNRRG